VLALATTQDNKVEVQTRLWDVEQRRPLLTLPTRLSDDSAAAVCPRTRRIVTYGHDGTVTVWDGHGGKQIAQFAVGPCGGFCISAGGQLATFHNENAQHTPSRVKVWDAVTGRLLHDLDVNTERVYSVAFDADGQRLAAVGESFNRVHGDGATGANGQLYLWDAATGRKLRSSALGGIGLSVAFSADGKLVAADASVRYGGEGSRVTIFDAETGEDKGTLSGLLGPVTSIAFSPDSSRVVTADNERLRVWNVLTGQELLSLPRTEGINSLTFTPDGHRLIAVESEFGEKRIHVFDGTPLPAANEDGKVEE
jgi:WD40 repeat protein